MKAEVRHMRTSRMRTHRSSRRAWNQFAQNWRVSIGWALCASRVSLCAAFQMRVLNEIWPTRQRVEAHRKGLSWHGMKDGVERFRWSLAMILTRWW